MTREKLVCCVVIVSGWLTVVSVVADTNSLPDLRNLDTSGWNCVNQPEGTPRDPAGAARNRVKNRDWTAVTTTNVQQWSFEEFLAHALAYEADVGGADPARVETRAGGKVGFTRKADRLRHRLAQRDISRAAGIVQL